MHSDAVRTLGLPRGAVVGVFLTQGRVGKEGRLFRAFKFRSMVPDAHKFAIKGSFGFYF